MYVWESVPRAGAVTAMRRAAARAHPAATGGGVLPAGRACALLRLLTQRRKGVDTLNVVSCCPVVLWRRAVASPHWVCTERLG